MKNASAGAGKDFRMNSTFLSAIPVSKIRCLKIGTGFLNFYFMKSLNNHHINQTFPLTYNILIVSIIIRIIVIISIRPRAQAYTKAAQLKF